MVFEINTENSPHYLLFSCFKFSVDELFVSHISQ